MDVYWLEQNAGDVPARDDWLSAGEARVFDNMRFAKRRADWRLGRWTAKCALAAYFDVAGDPHALAAIGIMPAPSGAPLVFFADQPAAVTISLSHRAGQAICAVARPGVMLGCDLEMVEPRSDAFAADYFAPDEQALVAGASPADRYRLLALLWSAKESALKALRVGLRLDTRCVSVSPSGLGQAGDDWHPLEARYADQTFQGWWQSRSNLIRTLVGVPPPRPPVLSQRRTVLPAMDHPQPDQP
jgi:4'-phosphopantetheinyl transferase